jgi:hypothetical protein
MLLVYPYALRCFSFLSAMCGATLVGSKLSAQSPAPAPAGVLVSGPGLAQAVRLSPAQLAALPRHKLVRPDHDGNPRTYSGVALFAVLQAAKVHTGAQLPGKGTAHYLLVKAADGYQAVFAMAEVDPAFAPRTVLLADRCDGRPLTAKDGPYEVVVPEEKKLGRCVRQVQRLQVLAAPR